MANYQVVSQLGQDSRTIPLLERRGGAAGGWW